MIVKLKWIVIITMLLSIIPILHLSKKDLWDSNQELLKEEILSLDDAVKTVDLAAITPFEWDTVYSFEPYTTKETIYQTIGYKWDNISETVNEGMNQIVFVKDGNVVCYLYGYPQNNAYGIMMNNEQKRSSIPAVILHKKEDTIFQLKRSENVYLLTKVDD